MTGGLGLSIPAAGLTPAREPRTGNALLLAFTALLLLPAFAWAESSVSLRASDALDESVYPYRRATLTVTNDGEQVVRAVSLRWAGGGPTMVFPAAIPPGAEADLDVKLPAAAVQQTYAVRLLADEDPRGVPLAETAASITWPVAWVTDEAFLDPSPYDAYGYAAGPWSRSERWRMLGLAGVAAVMMAATLLLRPPHRIAALTAAVALAGAGVWLLRPSPVRVQLIGGQGAPALWSAADSDRVLQVASRRTGSVSLADRSLPAAAPVYLDRRSMETDTLVVPASGLQEVPVQGGEVRYFRWRQPPAPGTQR